MPSHPSSNGEPISDETPSGGAAGRDRPEHEAAITGGTVLHGAGVGVGGARLRQSHLGRIVTVAIQGQQGVQAALQSAFAAHGVSAEIIYGAVRDLLDKPAGILLYATRPGSLLANRPVFLVLNGLANIVLVQAGQFLGNWRALRALRR